MVAAKGSGATIEELRAFVLDLRSTREGISSNGQARRRYLYNTPLSADIHVALATTATTSLGPARALLLLLVVVVVVAASSSSNAISILPVVIAADAAHT
jgi:hypothetical protein